MDWVARAWSLPWGMFALGVIVGLGLFILWMVNGMVAFYRRDRQDQRAFAERAAQPPGNIWDVVLARVHANIDVAEVGGPFGLGSALTGRTPRLRERH